jgi:hypothetical protein
MGSSFEPINRRLAHSFLSSKIQRILRSHEIKALVLMFACYVP